MIASPEKKYSQGPFTAGTVVLGTGTGSYAVSGSASDAVDALATSDGDTKYISANVPNSSFSKLVKPQNYGFSLPARAAPTGLVWSVERKSQVSSAIRDYRVRMTINNSTVTGDTNQATSTYDTTSYATYTYGGDDNLWGVDNVQAVTASDVNNSGFGVFYRSANDFTVSSVLHSITYCEATVYYTLPQSIDYRRLTDRGVTRLELRYRCNGDGEAEFLLGTKFPSINGAIDRLVHIPSEDSPPTDNFDITIEDEHYVRRDYGLFENLSGSSASQINGYRKSASGATGLWIEEPVRLKVSNAGEDGTGLIVLYVVTKR